MRQSDIRRAKKLKLIGQCRDCQWWRKDKDFPYGDCDKGEQGILFNEFISFQPDFGCIHWIKGKQ